MVFAVNPVIEYEVTLPTFKLLYEPTNDAKVFTVETSKKYCVAPALADQLADAEVVVTEPAAFAVGATGADKIVKVDTLVAVEAFTNPVVPAPAVTTIEVPVLEVIEETAVLPIVTLPTVVIGAKFVPLIVIDVPGHPEEGENEVIVGNPVTVISSRKILLPYALVALNMIYVVALVEVTSI